MRFGREQILGCGLVTQLSLTVVIAAIIPVLFGIWLDRQLHTPFPIITLILMVLGISLGTVAVYRNIAAVYKRIGGDQS